MSNSYGHRPRSCLSLAAVARSLGKAKLAPNFAHRLAAFTDF